MNGFTNEQKKALKSLERAFKKCNDLSIYGCVMDGDLIVCDEQTYNEAKVIESKDRSGGTYPTVAYSQETESKIFYTINDSGVIIDCGGF